MLQWTPFSKPPKDGQLILTRRGVIIQSAIFRSVFSEHLTTIYGEVWMPAVDILNAPMGYDRMFGDLKLCLCGHPYYRHFDTYEDMSPIGCKYCHYDIEGVEYQKETKVPKDVDVNRFEYKDWAPFASICSGFKWDGVEVPLAEWEETRHAVHSE
jgi:hypothetical protein